MKYINFADLPSKQAADINANFKEAGTYTPSYIQNGNTLVLRTVGNDPETAGRIKASPGIDPNDCITVLQGLIRAAIAPTSATSGGKTGDFFVDANYLYICKSFNSWVRIPTAAW